MLLDICVAMLSSRLDFHGALFSGEVVAKAGPRPVLPAGNGVLPPRVIHFEEPESTHITKRVNFDETAVLSAVVDIDGLAKQIKIVRSADKSLDLKAIEALRRYRFAPATHNGQPVPVSIDIQVRFRLHRE